MSRLKRLILEIHRRSLWQVLLIYIGGAWVCYEMIDTITDRLALPPWLPVLAIILFLIGLPFVVATAFVREEARPVPVPAEQSALPQSEADAATARHAARRRRFLTWRNAGLSFVVALALWGVVTTGWLLFAGKSDQEGVEAARERKMLVVLPFKNLGAPEDEYFADGITDAITARLAGLHGLGVTSSTSAFQYKDTEKNVREIGEELGVGYILEGTVQRERPADPASRVRVIPQLVRVSDDTHLWAATYDEEGSELFRVQSDIAERVAQALDVTLLEPERRSLEARPTENLEAYEYYLRGNEYFRALAPDDFPLAVEMYERAVELDAEFGLAYAALSWAHMRIHFFQGRGGALSRARAALDEATRLGPDLVETRIAQGYYHYWGSLDYERALEQFRIVQRRQPNNADALLAIGGILRRQGNWDEAVANFERAVELDPRREATVSVLAEAFERMRRYEDAERYQNRLISLNPDNPHFYGRKARIHLAWEGSTERARGVLQEASRRVDPASVLVPFRILTSVFGEEYGAALDRLTLGAPAIDTVDYFLAKAELNVRRSQSGLARAYYDSARVVLEARVQAQPAAYGRVAGELGVAYAGLGRTEEAVQAAKRALDLFPLSQDALRGAAVLAELAEIHVRVGEYDAAIDQLELLLSIPSPVSVQLLRVDRLWTPLRDHPRFQELLEDYQ